MYSNQQKIIHMTESKTTYTIEQSNAFLEEFELGPWCSGELSGLRFAVSDLIDVEERVTGCGNPFWLSNRPPAACNAVAVDLLLSAGSQCIGKTFVDEFGNSLLGESRFHGTPLNPNAPDHVPGGPIAGAASAVACGHVDFAIGVDSGPGVQITASNCRLFGYRPRVGSVSTAGLLPVAPSFDTIGILADTADHLLQVSKKLSCVTPDFSKKLEFVVLSEAWDSLSETLSAELMNKFKLVEQALDLKVSSCSLKDLQSPLASDLQNWYLTYREIVAMEIWSSFGTWVEERKPELGSEAKANIFIARRIDRSESSKYYSSRAELKSALRRFMSSDKVLCIPSASEPAPKKGFIASAHDPGEYYPSTLALCSLSAISGLPSLTLPLAVVDGVPIGLTLISSNDAALLSILSRCGS
jgi:amidase